MQAVVQWSVHDLRACDLRHLQVAQCWHIICETIEPVAPLCTDGGGRYA